MSISRRVFFLSGAATAVYGMPSDRIVLGVIGSGGRGTLVMRVFQKDPPGAVGRHLRCLRAEPGAGLFPPPRRCPATIPRPTATTKSCSTTRTSGRPHRHARALACADGARRAGRGQGRLRRKAAVPDARTGRANWWRPRSRSKNIIQVGMQRRSYDLYLEGREHRGRGHAGQRAHGALLVAQQLPAAAPASTLDGPLDWEQWQGPGEAPCRSTRTASATGAFYSRLRRRHRGGPGRARLRRHPPAHERQLSARGDSVGRQAAQAGGRNARIRGGDRRVPRGLHRASSPSTTPPCGTRTATTS